MNYKTQVPGELLLGSGTSLVLRHAFQKKMSEKFIWQEDIVFWNIGDLSAEYMNTAGIIMCLFVTCLHFVP